MHCMWTCIYDSINSALLHECPVFCDEWWVSEWCSAGRHCCQCDLGNSGSQGVKGIHDLIKLYTYMNKCKIAFTSFSDAYHAAFANYYYDLQSYLFSYVSLSLGNRCVNVVSRWLILQHEALTWLLLPLSRSVWGRCVWVLKLKWIN